MKFAFALIALTLALGACSAESPAAKPAAQALPDAPPPPPMLDEGGACAQDLRLCADGSYVSRSGAACAFAACPGAGAK
jgi:hypothetical protein